MKCPLLAIAWGPTAASKESDYPDCLQEYCGWWDKTQERCDPTGLLSIMIAIGNVLGKISDEMPFWKQFTT